ncbi:phage tail protein [Pseudoroseicyclus aestuarii]|uniref:Putative tail protein n=1 Tax=Pseudoroseicyclus aestuarii TaxID=1795041 RepID=A0A318SN86_9RHOB|nr:phage tail protein [Pseudoroseicyclus aestuarii]PYE80808.1 putative tail protein [Pseudoroseicyclus aestuarii]
MTFVLILLALLLSPAPAAADPASAIITAFSLTGFAAAAVQVGVGIGMSMLGNALQRKAANSTSAPGIRTQVSTKGGTTPQSFILGTYATRGNLVAPFYATGHADKLDNAYRYAVYDVGDLPVTALRRVWVNGDSFTPGDTLLGDLTSGEGAQPDLDSRPEYAGKNNILTSFDLPELRVWFYRGTQTAASPVLVDRFKTHKERPWTADMIGRNIPYAILAYEVDDDLWAGQPEPLFEIDGIPLYDPRTGTVAFTRNPAVMIWNLLRGIALPGGGTYGLGVPEADLPAEVWHAAMDACDQVVDGAPRYRAGYEVHMATPEDGGETPLDVIAELSTTCAAEVAEVGGSWIIRVGEPGLPVASITDEDILRSKPQDLDPFRGMAETVNAVRATFPDPAQQWNASEAPPRFDLEAEAEDGPRLVGSLDLGACPYPDQVQRLMAMWLKDARRQRRHTITLPPEFGYLVPLDTITWSSARNLYGAKLFEIAEVAHDPQTLCVTLALREVDPADYDPNITLKPAAPPSSEVRRTAPVVLPGLVVDAVTIKDQAGRNRRPGIRIRWSVPQPGIKSVQYRWRVAPDQIIDNGSTDVVGAGQTLIDGLLPDTEYLVQVGAAKRAVAWSGWISVRTAAVFLEERDLATTIREKIDLGAAGAVEAQAQYETLRDDLDDGMEAALAAAAAARQEAESANSQAIVAYNRSEQSVSTAARGDTLLRSQFMQAGTYQVYTDVAGQVTAAANAVYPIGQTLTTRSAGGSYSAIFYDSDSDDWIGPSDLDYIRVEIDFSLVSGNRHGSGVTVIWTTTDGDFAPSISFLSKAQRKGARYFYSAVFKKPKGITGTFIRNRVSVRNGSSAFGEEVLDSGIALHRVSVFTVTDEEVGNGLVNETFTAHLQESYLTKVDTEGALSAIRRDLGTEIDDKVGGLAANISEEYITTQNSELALAGLKREINGTVDGVRNRVSTTETAIADIDGALKAGVMFRAQSGGEVSLLDLMTAHDPNGKSYSVAKLSAGDILLGGTVYSRQMVITDQTNYLAGCDFEEIDAIPFDLAGNDRAFWAADFVHNGTHSLKMLGGARLYPAAHITCSPGNRFRLVFWARLSSNFDGGANTKVRFGDQNGNLIAEVVFGNGPKATWFRREFELIIPAGVSKLQVAFWADGTSGAAWLDEMELRRMTGGELLVAGTLTAELFDVLSMNVAGLAVFGGELKSSNFLSGVRGWRIGAGGNAEFNKLIVRNSMTQGAVSDYLGETHPTVITSTGEGAATIWTSQVYGPTDDGYVYTAQILYESREDYPISPDELVQYRRRRPGADWSNWVDIRRESPSSLWTKAGCVEVIGEPLDGWQFRIVAQHPNNASTSYPGNVFQFRNIRLTISSVRV